jgi:hypothetical protein
MAKVLIFPHVLVHRTRWGTRIEWHQGRGLLTRDEAGRCRAIGPEELRRGYPEAWLPWIRFAALLPMGKAVPLRPGSDAVL